MTVCNREGLFLLFEKIHCHSLSGAVTLENFNYSTVFLFIHIPSIWSFKGRFFCGKLDAAALKKCFSVTLDGEVNTVFIKSALYTESNTIIYILEKDCK